MAWAIEWTDGAVRDLRGFDSTVRRRLHRYLTERVVAGDSPRKVGEAL